VQPGDLRQQLKSTEIRQAKIHKIDVGAHLFDQMIEALLAIRRGTNELETWIVRHDADEIVKKTE
jgi:hypothetical protein